MNSTENIMSRLTMFANNAKEAATYKRTLLEASDRLGLLQHALGELIEDKQYINHDCQDNYCPLDNAVKVFCIGKQ